MIIAYLILRGKQKAKKTKIPENKVPPNFQWSEQNKITKNIAIDKTVHFSSFF